MADFWVSNLFHKICNEFFIDHCLTKRKVRFCVKLFEHFLTEYSSVWVENCRVSFQMFQKLLALQSALLSRFAKFFTLVSTILFWVYITLQSSENTYWYELDWHKTRYNTLMRLKDSLMEDNAIQMKSQTHKNHESHVLTDKYRHTFKGKQEQLQTTSRNTIETCN